MMINKEIVDEIVDFYRDDVFEKIVINESKPEKPLFDSVLDESVLFESDLNCQEEQFSTVFELSSSTA
jgi:hypothetical protein